MTSVVTVQLDLADAVMAAADLSDQDRRDAEFDMEVGDPVFAILTAVLGTRSPLPPDLLDRVRDGVLAGWYRSEDLTRAMLAAVDLQPGQPSPAAWMRRTWGVAEMNASDVGMANAIALNALADEVAAAADLAGDVRRDVDFDIEVGDPDFAIMAAVLGTRSPLPTPLLDRIQDSVTAGWYLGDAGYRNEILDAIAAQRDATSQLPAVVPQPSPHHRPG